MMADELSDRLQQQPWVSNNITFIQKTHCILSVLLTMSVLSCHVVASDVKRSLNFQTLVVKFEFDLHTFKSRIKICPLFSLSEDRQRIQ